MLFRGGTEPTRTPPVRPPLKVPDQPVTLSGVPMLGAEDGPVGLIVYSDFQCPYCAKFNVEVLPTLKSKFVAANQLRIGFRHLPLAIHPMARTAAESAECARRQSLFWPMHDALFADSSRLSSSAAIYASARGVGVEEESFAACMNGQARDVVEADIASAAALQIRSTPTFLLGRMLANGSMQVRDIFAGALPAQVFAERIQRVLGAGKQ